jgi:type II secretory pathway pseudopilin PulG
MGFCADLVLAGLLLRIQLLCLTRKPQPSSVTPQSNLVMPDSPRRAFTRVELLACLTALALLAALALPALAGTTSRSQVVQCLNNLRQMGRGVQLWGADHQNEPPWWTPTIYGGSYVSSVPGSKIGAVFYELTFMRNELATPRILACPADAGVKVASEFSSDPVRGFMSAAFQINANSYFLNLHTRSEHPSAPVFGDWNLRTSGIGGGCSSGANNTLQISFSDSSVGWTNAVHGPQGNIVLMDGSVTATTSEQVRQAFGFSASEVTPNPPFAHLLRDR